ncbi:hypothetical protein NPIL_480551, partial [Nephila pilipes]
MSLEYIFQAPFILSQTCSDRVLTKASIYNGYPLHPSKFRSRLMCYGRDCGCYTTTAQSRRDKQSVFMYCK